MSSDKHDPSNGWTSQSDYPKPEDHSQVVTNTVKESELPDTEKQRAVGVDPDLWRTPNLYVEASDK